MPLVIALVVLLGSVARVAAESNADPDLPPFLRGFDMATFLRLRDQEIASLRGFDDARRLPYNPRQRAIELFERQPKIRVLANQVTWAEIGPRPIPNGQTEGVSNPVTGRMTALEIDPTDNNRLYLGTAQGGVWRSLDGGTTWIAIFDTAQSLAIGALALAPSDPTILFVGTGEANGSADSFAGVGLYRIDNAPTTATLVGPINPVRNYIAGDGVTPVSNPVFNGRSIGKILVHPTDRGTLFVGTAGGVIGMGGDVPLGGTIPPLGMRGLYRLGNATGAPASVTVVKLAVTTAAGGFDTPNTGNRNVTDVIFPDPANPNAVVCWVQGTSAAGDGGIYRSTNALAATPTFTQVLTTTGTGNVRGQLVSYVQAAPPTNVVYSAAGESRTGTSCATAGNDGALRVSTDGGQTWSAKLSGGGGFCGGQCFYDLGLDVRPGATAAVGDDLLWLGGTVTSPPCSRLHAKSTDGGATFSDFATGLHADTHFVKVDPTNPSIVYHGNDGGIFKSTDGGNTWSSLNNSPLSATQFQSVATHSADASYSIGGTQDNGTNMYTTAAVWNRVDFGDGGYARIDQSTASTSVVTLYHTYFNQTNNLLGFGRVNTTACATDGEWSFKGRYGGAVDPTVHCDSTTDTFNGITLTDAVNFYAPVELGPGTPNAVYYGSDRLYRSTDKGDTMTVVSQAPIVTGVPIRTIGISPLNDNFRLAGLINGQLFGTTTGSSTLTNLTTNLPTPLKQVLRAVFDTNDATGNTAYVSLGGYWGNATGHVYKTTNLASGVPTWVAASGSGGTRIPDVPVNTLLIDPLASSHVYAGTDIGVYFSSDAGASWNPLGSNLPRVAVFEMALSPGTPATRVIRVATHGRGMWELIPPAPEMVADLSITKTDGQATAVPGASITYTIVASNAGPSAASGATVADTVPAAITGASWTCAGAGGGVCTAGPVAGDINDSVSLPVGASVTYTLTGTIDPAATGSLGNTARVTAPGGVTDPNPANNSATDTDTLTPQADLAITKTDGQTTTALGAPITYTIVASNAGPSPVSGATVADTVPAAITGATWTCVGSGAATCTATGSGNINDPFVNLPVGDTVTYTLTGIVSVTASSPIVNTATVTPPPGFLDPNPLNNSARDADTIPFACGAEIIVVPDGRLTTTSIPGSTTLWFGGSLKIGNSYSVEFKNQTGVNVPPGTVTVFSGDDGCSGTSTVIVNDTSGSDPGGTPGTARLSFTTAGSGTFFHVRLVNGSGSPVAFTFGLSDTTMYSPAWSTNGSFNTYYSFQNTTGTALSGTLTLLDTGGLVLSTFPVSVPGGQTASTNTQALGVLPNKTGTARFTHNGPPGSVVAEAAIANFSISPAYVQPVKFVPVRDAR